MNHWISRSAGLALIAGTALSLLFLWQGEQPHGWMGPGQVQGDSLFLAVMWGLILLGLASLWLHARRTGHASLMGEMSLVIGAAGYLMFVRDSGIVPNIGPWPSGDDLGLLGLTLFLLSMFLQGVVATMNRLLPLWSTLPLTVAPLLSARLLTLGVGLSVDPLRGPADVLYMSVAWLLLGYALLRLPSDTRRRPTSTSGSDPGTQLLA